MHFFYLDETGCTGPNLKDLDQPIFVIGGISVSDERWRKTTDAIQLYPNSSAEIYPRTSSSTHTSLSLAVVNFWDEHAMNAMHLRTNCLTP